MFKGYRTGVEGGSRRLKANEQALKVALNRCEEERGDGFVAPYTERHDEGEGAHSAPGAVSAGRRRAHRLFGSALLPRALSQGVPGP